jgi:phosphoglycerol transferase MdoB-like AlkP superfamily enzyme
MRNILANLAKIFCYYVYFLLLLQLQRWTLLYVKSTTTLGYTATDLFNLFKMGFLFDTQAIAYALLSLFVFVWHAKIFSVLALTLTYLFTLCVWVDFYFFDYFNAHLNALAFGAMEMENTLSILRFLWQDYPVFVMFIALIASLFIGYFAYSLIEKIKMPPLSLMPVSLVFLGYVALHFLALRGSVSTFPLINDDRIISPIGLLNDLTVNGFFSLKETLVEQMQNTLDEDTDKTLRQYGFTSIEQAIAALQERSVDTQTHWQKQLTETTSENLFLQENPPHVVFLQMERFATYYLQAHSQNFNLLGRFAKYYPDLIKFENFTSMHQGTLHSLLFFVMNNVTHADISKTKYRNHTFATSNPLVFAGNGYHTLFVTSGRLGWNNLFQFLPAQGFQEIAGDAVILHAYPDAPKHEDWGVFDHSMFDYAALQLKNATKPYFIYGMSTTHHPPFKVPSSYTPYPMQWSEKIENLVMEPYKRRQEDFLTFQYVTDALGGFFQQLEQAGLLENTIIAITGDHTPKDNIRPHANYLFEQAKVPLLLHVPEKYKRFAHVDTTKFGSHKDIFPTLYHLSLSNASYYKTGNNLLDKQMQDDYALYYSLYFDKQGAYEDNGIFSAWTPFGLQKSSSDRQEVIRRKIDAYFAVFQYLIKDDVRVKK